MTTVYDSQWRDQAEFYAAAFEQDIISIMASSPDALRNVGKIRDAIAAGAWGEFERTAQWFRSWLKKSHDAAGRLTMAIGFVEVGKEMDSE